MIVVVGGGITGLAVGRALLAEGVDVTVLEAASEPGGVIRSARVDGHLLEWGPQRTRLTGGLRTLVDDLELGSEVLEAPRGLRLSVYRDSRLRPVPFTLTEAFRTDLLSLGGKLRILAEPFTGGVRPGESVASYLSRKLGTEAYHHLVGPLYGGLYGSDPADMLMELSLSKVLRRFGVRRSLVAHLLRRGGRIAPPPAVSFREGMQTLPRAMAESLGGALRLGTVVTGVGRHEAGWRVELEGGVLEAEQVVLTVPAPVAARLLAREAPEASARVGALRYNPLVVVHLLAETDLRGLGFQVSLAEGLPLKGVTFNDSLFGRSGVYTAYLGGAAADDLLGRTDDALGSLAVEQFRRTTGHTAEWLTVEREAMPAWDRSWSHLQGLRLPAGLHLATNWTSRPGIPGRLEQASRVAVMLARPSGSRHHAG